MHQKYNEYDYFIDDESYDKIAATCAAMYSYKQSRVTPPVCRHLNWRLHVKKLHRECQFHRMYLIIAFTNFSYAYSISVGSKFQYGTCISRAGASLLVTVFGWWFTS